MPSYEKRFVALGVATVFSLISFYGVRRNKELNIEAIRVGPGKDVERMKMKLQQRELEAAKKEMMEKTASARAAN